MHHRAIPQPANGFKAKKYTTIFGNKDYKYKECKECDGDNC